MKATLSKDGLPRFTLTLRRRVGAEDLVEALGWLLSRDYNFYVDNPAVAAESALKLVASRKKILAAAARAYGADGDSVWVWAESCPAADTLREQAMVLVLSKFPELRPGGEAVCRS